MNARIPSKTTINKTTNHPSFCIAGVEISSFDFDLGSGQNLSQGGIWKMAEHSLNQLVHCPETNLVPGDLKKEQT